MSKTASEIKEYFEQIFSHQELMNAFHDRHADAVSRGIDRRNGASFGTAATSELLLVSKKCLDGTYRFTPYLESLKVKDRSSIPRMISIPSVRDRVVLTQLNKLLHFCFPGVASTRFASEYVRDIAAYLGKVPLATTWTAGADIRKFYDSISRARLQKLLNKGLRNPLASKLVHHAVSTPTVPKTYRRKDLDKYRREVGVPQGLAISNALAAIYMHEVDGAMAQMPVRYFRFVDDVLVVGSKEDTAKAVRSFGARVRARGLATHLSGDKKGHHSPLTDSFSYLGYVFRMPNVSVRESTVERLLQSLAAKITDYKYNKQRILEKRQYLTADSLREAFIDELNERISGAISGKRRYGWIAYFSQITDESILHRIDDAVRRMLLRDPELAVCVKDVKRFSRALFEMRHRPQGGYVRDYDKFNTPAQMLSFLVFRGRVNSAVALTSAQIVEKFEAYRSQQLSAMLADEASLY